MLPQILSSLNATSSHGHTWRILFIIWNSFISQVLFPNIIVIHVNFAKLLAEKKIVLFKFPFLLTPNEIDFFVSCLWVIFMFSCSFSH